MSGQPGPSRSSYEESRESLYSILNLPVSASQDDIRHRYKELAVIFHPDRQHGKDEHTKRTAGNRFRAIQRAYEVLSDPEQRQIYDTLGEGGLAARSAVGQRFTSPDEFRAEVERLVDEIRGRQKEVIISRGEISCALDASDAFTRNHDTGLRGLPSRARGIKQTFMRLEHTMGVKHNQTQVLLSGRIQAIPFQNAPRDYGNVLGTIRHQFSPRVLFEATAALLRSHSLNLKTTYSDEENSVSIKAHLSPRTSVSFPPLTLELQRRLFLKTLTLGTVTFATGPKPSFTVSVSKPMQPEGVFTYAAGFQLNPLPTFSMEIGTRPLSGGLKAKMSIGAALTGAQGSVHGIWEGPNDSSVDVGVGAAISGSLFVNVNLQILGQRLLFPIVLSHEADVMIGLCALVVPSVVAGLAHNFLIKPRLRARRISKLHAAQRIHRDRIQKCQEEAEGTTNMLLDTAHKRAEQERAIGGLVLLAATYTASGEEGEFPISVDVTVPLQAQVHNSQLVIPGGRSKAGLLGFYDPSPGARKQLKIEYLFHGALHEVEVGDFGQVVLPLRAHLVNE